MYRNNIVIDCSRYGKRVYGFDGTDHDIAIARQPIKEQMCTNAIHNNGIYKTFSFSENCHDLRLDYIKIEDKDIELYPDMFEYRFDTKPIPSSQTDDNTEYKDILESCIIYNKTGEIDDKLKHVFKEIKEEECVKKYNAIYSSVNISYINIYENNESIFIHYGYYFIKDEFINKIGTYDVIFGEAPLPYGEWFIDYSGPWPADRPRRKENIALSKDVEKALKNKGYGWCSAPVFDRNFPSRNGRYYSDDVINELLKENNNMNDMKICLLVAPVGMDKEFVNLTKKTLQSNDHTMLYISSNDIDIDPTSKYKSKYDLFEYWINNCMIYSIEFMLGYENDPEAKAFESFIRGARISNSTTHIVSLVYQKDTIEKVVNNLRNDYVESSEVNNKLHNITDNIMDKVNFFKEFGLEQADLDKIRNANCDKDACFTAVLKMTDIAFASDNKKGNKKK